MRLTPTRLLKRPWKIAQRKCIKLVCPISARPHKFRVRSWLAIAFGPVIVFRPFLLDEDESTPAAMLLPA